MDRLNRIRLLMGKEAVDKLKNSTVMVVGCGEGNNAFQQRLFYYGKRIRREVHYDKASG